jgi:hypothetical protein
MKIHPLTVCWLLFATVLLPGIRPAIGETERIQLLRNGGFEEDEMTLRGECAASCGGHSNDQWFNMQDRFPDGWSWTGVYFPGAYGMAAQSEWPREEVALDTTIRRSGKFSVRLQGKAATLQQAFEWNTLMDLYRDIPEKKDFNHTTALVVRDGFFQDLQLEGWVRTQDVPADAKATVSFSLPGLVAEKVDLPKDAAEWKPFQVTLSARALAEAAAKTKETGKTLDVSLTYTSPSGTGKVWFDDLSLTTTARTEPNLLPNASFEQVVNGVKGPDATGRGTNMSGGKTPPTDTPYPEGWSAPKKWVYLAPPYYYIWNNWFHFFGPCRGFPRADRLVARSGTHSLRMDLLGGDEYSLQSAPIALAQQELRPIEVTAWVKADRLRHFDLMLVDQEGRRLPTNTTLTYWGGLLAGTHDWIAVRKIFQGYEPVKSVRLQIAGRGFNGTTKTDIGDWHAYNQVSTVWIDDVAVREIYSTAAELAQRGVTVPPAPAPAGGVRCVGLDLGERLYGENAVIAGVKNDGTAPANAALEVRLITPGGKAQDTERSKRVEVKPGESASLSAPYVLKELSPSWREPGRLEVSLLLDEKVAAKESYSYGTWPAIAEVRPSKAYLDETENPILVVVNLGLAEKSLARVRKLSMEVVDRRTGKSFGKQVVEDVPAAIASAKIENASKDRFYFYMPRGGQLDHRNLVLREMDISKLPPRPWNDPEADWVIRVRGEGFTADSHPFGRLTKFDEVLPPIKEVTVDPAGKFFRVNGQPFFPFAQSHLNGAACGGALPSRSVTFSPEHARECNMNGAGRWSGVASITNVWNQGKLYSPMVMGGCPPEGAKDPNFMVEKAKLLDQGQIYLANTFGDPTLHPLADLTASPSALTYFVGMDEAIMEATISTEQIKALAVYGDAARKKINRPIGIMDNHSQYYPWHDDDGFLDHIDALYMEREEGAVWRPELTLRNWMKRKKEWVLCDLPQTYENVPHARERYRSLVNTLNGSRGWFGIQGCSDPSLYRGLGGELRHIFTYLSANEGGAEVTVPEGVQARAWKKGNSLLVIAEQHNPIPHGTWQWAEGLGGRPARAHTGTSSHLVTPVKEGYAIHGYNDDVAREVAAGDVIRQEIYLSPEKMPQAVFLIVPGNGDFNHIAWWGKFDWNDFRAKKIDAFLAGECYSAPAYGINWYRSTEKSWLDYQAAHRFPASCFVAMGDLPAKGAWNTLSVPIEKLNLAGRAVDGLMFMSSGDGLVYWGKSSLVRKDGKEETLLDGRIGRDPEMFRKATIAVTGLGNGNVRVVGETRSLKMSGGRWTDDLCGEDLYDSFREGWLGDGICYGQPIDSVPEAIELGYTYDDSPRAIRVYEITPEK